MLFCSKPSEGQFSKHFHSREEIPCAQREKKPTKKLPKKLQQNNPKNPEHFIVKANCLYIILKNVKVVINSIAYLHVITVCF